MWLEWLGWMGVGVDGVVEAVVEDGVVGVG